MAYTTINKGSSYFNTITYTGTGATNSLTGVNFKPDWVWIKQRGGVTWHNLYDINRGVTKSLASNDTGAEDTRTTGLTSFNTDGFTVGTDANANGSSNTYVAWNWLAANSTATNTSGSITSTVSANTTSGFSIVSYTGTGANATVGHGLGVVPKMYMVKCRSTTGDWRVYTATTGNTGVLFLNDISGTVTQANMWNSTTPTSSVFSLGTNANGNSSGATYIAYCFAEVKGFSKFGSYTGNGSTNGSFVYTGFKPAFVMAKSSSVGGYSWAMSDNKRNPFNQANNTLYANAADAEYTSLDQFDLLSNGFKLRSIYGNTTGDTYIYMAFAENPFVSATAIPTTAR